MEVEWPRSTLISSYIVYVMCLPSLPLLQVLQGTETKEQKGCGRPLVWTDAFGWLSPNPLCILKKEGTIWFLTYGSSPWVYINMHGMQPLWSFHVYCGSNITTQIGTNLQALLTQKRKKRAHKILKVFLYTCTYTLALSYYQFLLREIN